MKKISTYSIVTVLVAVLFTSCAKEKIYDNPSPWLSQESGNVVYSNNPCGIYVVETNYGYTVIQNFDGLRTYEDDVMYGNFGAYGTRDFFNYTANIVTRGNVVEYDLTYNEALNLIEYYCPLGKASGLKIKQSINSKSKILRTVVPAKQ